MPTITFNAFSSLQKKLKQRNMESANAVMEIASGLSAGEFVLQMGFSEKEVDAVFINGRVRPLDTVIEEGDRVAFVPNFIPGTGKALKGLDNIKKALKSSEKPVG